MNPTVKDIANLPADRLPPLVHVPRVTKPFDVTIRPPGSKSLTNRALLLAAQAEGESVLTGALADADDAQVMVRALRQLGAEIEVTPEFEPNGESCGNATIRVKGVGGRWKIKAGETVTLNLNNAGTATRFLTAAAVLQPPDSGGIVIDGNARMRERPIGELVEWLRSLGAEINYVSREGYPPVMVRPRLPDAHEITVTARASSQYVSALLLIAPWLPRGLFLRRQGIVVSESYVLMTTQLLRRVGAEYLPTKLHLNAPPDVVRDVAHIAPRPLASFCYAVEPDASGAAPLLCAAALGDGWKVTIPGLNTMPDDQRRSSLQGDAAFFHVLEMFGAFATTWPDCVWARGCPGPLRGASLSLGLMPDCAMAAAVVAGFAQAESRLRGLRTLRVKETDRIRAVELELAKVGVDVRPFSATDSLGEVDEGMHIIPPSCGIDPTPSAPPVEFDTYDDHRMAMSLALIGLRRPNVYIRDPGCVRKTYPTFWRDLAKLYG